MDDLQELWEDTEKKLGRLLRKNEIDFLQWVYERYTEEQRQKVNS